MTWSCAAIDHGVAIFPNGKIGPCCKIKSDYLKPISQLSDPNKFSDLKTESPPDACYSCVLEEHQGYSSYRSFFNNTKTSQPGLQFVDIRNTNLCNLKCRYCGPHFSSKWGQESRIGNYLQHQDISAWIDYLITDSLQWMYFTGGEPMLSQDHWSILQHLVDIGHAKNIKLMYNSNLTTVRFKDVDIESLWKNFKEVHVNCSIDAVGKPLEFIRSGSNWQQIDNNLQHLIGIKTVNIVLTPVVSILNFWFLPDLLTYAAQHRLQVNPIILQGPDYLALDVIPDSIKSYAVEILNLINTSLDQNSVSKISSLIQNNINQCLFMHTVNHILLLDSKRNEKLFDLLPFNDLAIEMFIKNYEYDQR